MLQQGEKIALPISQICGETLNNCKQFIQCQEQSGQKPGKKGKIVWPAVSPFNEEVRSLLYTIFLEQPPHVY